jgi:Flp pilus assembly protein TadD
MMRRLAPPLVAALLLSGCGGGAYTASVTGGADVQRQLRVASAAERGGNLSMALQAYASAYAAHPADAEVASRYAKLLLQTGDPERARDVLAEARRRNPRDALLLQTEAQVLLEVGLAGQALALFDEHLRWARSDARSLNGRGIALDMLGRHQEARAAYRAARAADPQNPVITGNLALSLMLTGCTEGAAAVLDTTPRSVATSGWIGQIRGAAPGFTAMRSSAAGDPCAGLG